jgi:protein-tyrosine phosphatase
VNSLSIPSVREGRGPDDPYSVCFVCTGNICRSPMAAVILRQLDHGARLAADLATWRALEVTSAGTGNWHEGEPMHALAARALKRAGYDDVGHVARPFEVVELGQRDLIVGLDRRHERILAGLTSSPEVRTRLRLLRNFDSASGGDVDVFDPYYGDDEEFDRCLALIEAGCRGLYEALGPALATGSDSQG